MLQLLVEQLHSHDQIDPLWMYFNKCLNQLGDGYRVVNETNVQPKDAIEFSAWLLYGLSKVYGYCDSGTYMGSSCLRVSEFGSH